MKGLNQRFSSAIGPLLVVNIIAFFIQAMVPGFTERFMLLSADVWVRSWIMLTSMFLHGSLSHLFFNMFMLWMFGPLIEQRIGRNRFLGVYFAAGILAALVSTFFYTAALGASGAIMGILGVTVMLMPHLRVLLFFVIPMSLRTAAILFAVLDIFGVFAPSGVANIAHLVGLAIGLAYGYYLLHERKAYQGRLASKPKKKSHRYEERIMMSEGDVEDYLKHGRL